MELYTPRGASVELGGLICEHRLRQAVEDGELRKAPGAGTRMLLRKADIIEWIERCLGGAPVAGGATG